METAVHFGCRRFMQGLLVHTIYLVESVLRVALLYRELLREWAT